MPPTVRLSGRRERLATVLRLPTLGLFILLIAAPGRAIPPETPPALAELLRLQTAAADSLAPYQRTLNDAEKVALLKEFNASGGVPFFELPQGLRRVRTRGADLDSLSAPPDMARHQMNRDLYTITLAGETWIVFAHTASPISSATSLWRKHAGRLRLEFQSYGDLTYIEQKSDGLYLAFGDTFYVARARLQSGVIEPLYMIETPAMNGAGDWPELPAADASRASVRAPVANLYATPTTGAERIGQYRRGAAVLVFGKTQTHYFVAAAHARPDDWTRRFYAAGNFYRTGWLQLASLEENR